MAVKKKMVMSKKTDIKQDAKMMKGMNPAQKAKFKTLDKKMDVKKPSIKADMRMDKSLRNRIMRGK